MFGELNNMMSVEVEISLDALAKMIAFDKGIKGKETAGLLLGKEEGNILKVIDIESGEQEATSVHVQLTDDALVKIVSKLADREDGLSIVGWWHTHPGLSAFMSPTDIRTQSLYQAMFEKAIAIVLDPLKYQQTWNINDLDIKVFRVKDGEYYELPFKIDGPLALLKEKVKIYEKMGIYPLMEQEVTVSSYETMVIPKPSSEQIHRLERLLEIFDDNPQEKAILEAYILGLKAFSDSTEQTKIDAENGHAIKRFLAEIKMLEKIITEYEMRMLIAKDNLVSGLWLFLALLMSGLIIGIISLILSV